MSCGEWTNCGTHPARCPLSWDNKTQGRIFSCVHIIDPLYLRRLRSQWLFPDHNFNIGRNLYANDFQIHIPIFEHVWIPVTKFQPLSGKALGHPAHLGWPWLWHHYPCPLLPIELSNAGYQHCVFPYGWNFWAILDSFLLPCISQ